MKIRKNLILVAILATTLVATKAKAQEQKMDTTVVYSNDKYKVETNHFWDNWYISAGAGAQILFGDHNKQMQLKDRFTPAFDFSFGKWFTPGIGVRAAIGGVTLHGLSGWTNHSATDQPNTNWNNYQGFIKNAKYDQAEKHWRGEVYKDAKPNQSYEMYKTEIQYLNTHVDVMFNLTNIFWGYNENNKYNFIPYIGVGWATTLNGGIYSDNKSGRLEEGHHSNEVSANIGLLNEFRLTDGLWLNLDIRGTYVNDRFDAQVGRRYGEGIAAATLGLTYKFNQRGWDKSKTIIIKYDENEINNLRQRLKEIEAANKDLENKLNAKPTEVAKEKVLAGPLLITFVINKTDLSNRARVNLGFLAEAIKKNPNSVFIITGYADKGTGTSAINERLSKGRAEAVYNCLVNEYGVSPSQIKAEYKGGVENMFYDDPRLSRAVITRVE